jgi:Regulator of chromosome condensation (RCC1) repeat
MRRVNQGGSKGLLFGSAIVLSACWLSTPGCTLADASNTPKGDAGAASNAGGDASNSNGGDGDTGTAGNAATGGTSVATAGSATGGTSAGGTSAGGTSAGETSTGGTSAGGATDNAAGDSGTVGGANAEAGAGGVGPTCADTQSDPNNCGSCGHVCPAPVLASAKASCTAGTCGATCPAGTLGDGARACIPITSVAAGVGFTCGLQSDGHVKCWGDTNVDLNPAGLGNVLFKSITAADQFVCGIRDNGLAYCWGNDEPTAPSGTFYAIAAGSAHVCGIKSDFTLACWSVLDNGTSPAPTGTFKLIASGQDFSCAAVQGGNQDGRAKCWGNGAGVTSDFPTTAKAETFTQLYAGGPTGWGVHADGSVHSWGQVYFSAPADTLFKTIAPGGAQNRCGILKDSSLTCWGIPNNDVTLAPSGAFKAVAMGGAHACAVKSNGNMTCWGSNSTGQAPTTVSGSFQGYW